MAKKKSTRVSGKKITSSRTSGGFNPEKSRWLVPVTFGVFFIALVILFRDFLFSDKMLHGSDTIQAGIFLREFYIQYFHQHGSIPQWNPHIFGGMPYVEAFNGDIFYPFSVLKFFGSIFRMMGIIQFLHIFMAGIFMYFTAREFRLTKIASLFAAACYMFAGYLVSFVSPGHDGKLFVTTLFPLVILCIHRGFRKQAFLSFSMLGLVLGIIILTPHPQMSYFTLWAAGLYTLFKLVMLYLEKRSVVPLVKPAGLAMYAVIIGLLLSSIQFFPGYFYTTHFSPRADAKKGWEWATSWSMHEEEAMSIIIPEFAGVTTQDRSSVYWGKNPFRDNTTSPGTIAFFLALTGFLFVRRREAYFFGGLAIFALFYALADTTPVFKIFYYLIPKVSSMRAPGMIMFMFSFSCALLAGMLVQYIQLKRGPDEEKRAKRFNYVLLGIPGLLLVLALLFSVAGRSMINLWTWLFYSDAAQTMVQQNLSKLDLAYYNLPNIQSGAWLAFLFTALAIGCIWLYRARKAPATILLALVMLPVLNGVRLDNRFISTYDQFRHWAKTPLVNFLLEKEKTEDRFRVMDLNDVKSVLLPYFGLDVTVGYHGNQLRWYDDLIGSVGITNRYNPNMLNLTGTRYLITQVGQNLPPLSLGRKPLQLAGTFGNQQVYYNPNALPRVFLVDSVVVEENRQDIYPLILNDTANLRRLVYLEKDPEPAIPKDTTPGDTAWIMHYEPDSVRIMVKTDMPKILVLTDNYYDAWRAYIDGTQTEVYRAYGTFRAVVVPAGEHQVKYDFYSPRYVVTRTITLVTSLYLLVIMGVYLFGSRKKQVTEKGDTEE